MKTGLAEFFACCGNLRVRGQAWWLCGFYAITFGGYVGLSSFLPVFLRDQFAMSPASAGLLTAGGALAGSIARPLGGYLADRFGGARLLQLLLVAIALAYTSFGAVSTLRSVVPLLIGTMICLGLGNGVVFQLVPRRFPGTIGLVTGLVGAVGGVGGFLLPTVLGAMKQSTGSFGAGLAVLGAAAGAAAVGCRCCAAEIARSAADSGARCRLR